MFLFDCRLVSAQSSPNTNGAIHAQATRPVIYDESADGSKQISDALVIATKEHKRVLLQFGANWCIWCHRLHTLFETDQSIAEILKSDYVVVMIDVNKGHNGDLVKKYDTANYGLPFLVVLDANGEYLLTQSTGALEEGDHHSPQKVLTFLKKWTPTR